MERRREVKIRTLSIADTIIKPQRVGQCHLFVMLKCSVQKPSHFADYQHNEIVLMTRVREIH